MAGVQWARGKCHGAGEAKAFFRHNDAENYRLKQEHSNPHIDKSLTKSKNFSYKGLSYDEKCERYDELVEKYNTGRQSSGKNARTTMQNLVVYAPKGLPNDKIRPWFNDVGSILSAKYGELFIDMAVECDELHEYTDRETREKVLSRCHGHASLIPVVDGVLNGKKFSERKNITILNNEIDKMTREKYGLAYVEGKGTKNGKSVEQLKSESAAIDAENRKNAAERQLHRRREQIAQADRELRSIKTEGAKIVNGHKAALKDAEDTFSSTCVSILQNTQKASEGLSKVVEAGEAMDDDQIVLSFMRTHHFKGKNGEPKSSTIYDDIEEQAKRWHEQQLKRAEEARKQAELARQSRFEPEFDRSAALDKLLGRISDSGNSDRQYE